MAGSERCSTLTDQIGLRRHRSQVLTVIAHWWRGLSLPVSKPFSGDAKAERKRSKARIGDRVCRQVVFKLFEFMHETFPGVQPPGQSCVCEFVKPMFRTRQSENGFRQMAVDTFLRICQKCKKKFITQQAPPFEGSCREVSRCADQCAMCSYSQNNEPAPFIETMPSHIAQDS